MSLRLDHNSSNLDAIALLYYAFKDCGRIDDIFDGHDLMWWLDQFNQRDSWLCVKDNRIMGFGLVNTFDSSGLRAELSFGFLPDCSGFEAVRFGKMMLKALFESRDKLKYCYGTTPSRNKKAVQFARLIGMRVVGTTPNYLSYRGEIDHAVTTYIERESVLGQRETTEAD